MEQEHQSTMEETEEEMLRPELGTAGGSDTKWNDPGGYSTRKVQPG